MDAFSYLSVLLSIIVGLAMTQVLQGHRALLLARRRVIPHAPALIWSVLMLVFATQVWWSSFGLADHRNWTFLSFAVVLLQMVLLYLMSALVLPDVPDEGAVNLRDHYEREVAPFFGILLAVLVTGVVKDWVLEGRLPSRANLLFHAAIAAVAVVAIAYRRPGFHLAVAVGSAALLATYIAALFARL